MSRPAASAAAPEVRGSGRPVRARSAAPVQHRIRQGYRTRIAAWVLLGLFFGGTAAWSAVSGEAAAVFLMVLLAGLMLAAGIGPRLAVSGVSVQRQLTAGPVRHGEALSSTISLQFSWVFPFIWMTVREEIVHESASAAEGRLSFTSLPFLLTRRQLELANEAPARRGVYRFSSITVTAGDIFGLTAVSRTIVSTGESVVWPAVLQATGGFAVSAGTEAADAGSVLHLSSLKAAEPSESLLTASRKLPGAGQESRPYRTGDPLRAIDWRSAAKGRPLQIKQLALDDEAEAVIVLDTSAESYGGDGRWFDYAAAYAALAVEEAASQGAAVRLVIGPQVPDTAAEGHAERGGSTLRIGPRADIEPLLHALAKAHFENKVALSEWNGVEAKLQLPVMNRPMMMYITGENNAGDRLIELAGKLDRLGMSLKAYVICGGLSSAVAKSETERIERMIERLGIVPERLTVPDSFPRTPVMKGDAS